MSAPDASALPKNEREDILRSRFSNRRRMAWISFAMMMFWSCLIIAGVTVNPGAPEVAEALAKVTALLGTLFMMPCAIILAYIGASSYEHSKVNF